MGTRRAAHVAVALLAACGGGTGGDPDANTVDGPPDAQTEVAVTGRVLDWINRAPMTEVAVSVVDHPEIPAVATSAEGRYRVEGVPVSSQIRLRMEKENYVPLLTRVFAIGAADYVTYDGGMFDAMASRSAVDLTGTVLGEPYDPAKGGIVIRLQRADNGDPVTGATVSFSSAGHAPLYFNSSEFPDPNLTETTSAGLVVLHNYDLGVGQLSVGHATLSACAGLGPDSPPLPLDIDVVADTTTWVPLECGAP